jgi:hypothetical protein
MFDLIRFRFSSVWLAGVVAAPILARRKEKKERNKF